MAIDWEWDRNSAPRDGQKIIWIRPDFVLLNKGVDQHVLIINGFFIHFLRPSDFKIWPITFQGSGPSGPILFSCEQISL